MQHLNFRDWSVAYRRSGSGPSLLFIHNGGTSHRIWLDVMARLERNFDVIAIDLLGYGESSKPGHSYDMGTYVELVLQVLDTLSVDRVTLVGNCMGSAISLHVADTIPERISGIVLVNPLTEQTFSSGWLGSVLKARQLSPGMVGALYQGLGKMRLPSWSAPTALSFQFGSRGRKQGLHNDPALKGNHSSEGQLHSMLSVLANIEAYAAVDAFRPSDAANFPPIATFWGQANRVLSAKKGEQLNQQLKPVQSGGLPDCGHLVMMEAPEEVADFIQNFYDSHVANRHA